MVMGWTMDIEYSGLVYPASRRGKFDSGQDFDNICPVNATEISIN